MNYRYELPCLAKHFSSKIIFCNQKKLRPWGLRLVYESTRETGVKMWGTTFNNRVLGAPCLGMLVGTAILLVPSFPKAPGSYPYFFKSQFPPENRAQVCPVHCCIPRVYKVTWYTIGKLWMLSGLTSSALWGKLRPSNPSAGESEKGLRGNRLSHHLQMLQSYKQYEVI